MIHAFPAVCFSVCLFCILATFRGPREWQAIYAVFASLMFFIGLII